MERVRRGDFVLSDEHGDIVVPTALVDPVFERADHLTASEVQIRAAFAEEAPAECFERFGRVCDRLSPWAGTGQITALLCDGVVGLTDSLRVGS